MTYMLVNKDENTHRYGVRGKKKERWREREKRNEWERDRARDRKKKEIWKLWSDLKVLTTEKKNLLNAFIKT